MTIDGAITAPSVGASAVGQVTRSHQRPIAGLSKLKLVCGQEGREEVPVWAPTVKIVPDPASGRDRCLAELAQQQVGAMGSGGVQEKQKTYLDEIIEKVEGCSKVSSPTTTNWFT